MNRFSPRISGETYTLINSLIASPGRRRAELDPRVTWEDVGGLVRAKESMIEIVDFLASPRRYQALGARIPKHILLTGPPGCGKSLLARAVLDQAGVPAFWAWGSEFVLLWSGVGAARLRNFFRSGRENRPALLLIDDIDAFARPRDAGSPSEGVLERHQTLSQLMKEMDDRGNAGVILLATTNRPDLLDPALLQPARFERIVEVGPPDEGERQSIFDVHLRDKPLEEDVQSSVLAARTAGFTGAGIRHLVNEAALLAVRTGKQAIGMAEFEAILEQPASSSQIVDHLDGPDAVGSGGAAGE